MKLSPLLTLALAICASGLVSCTSFQTTMQKVTTPIKASLAKLHSPIDTPPIVKIDKTKLIKSQVPEKTELITASRSPITTTPTSDWKKVKSKKITEKKTVDKAAKRAKADAIAWKRKKEAADKKDLPKEKALVRKKIDPSTPPIDEQIPTFGILPSLTPGESTSISDLDNVELELPDDIAALPPVPSLPPEEIAPDISTIPDELKPSIPTPALKSGE